MVDPNLLAGLIGLGVLVPINIYIGVAMPQVSRMETAATKFVKDNRKNCDSLQEGAWIDFLQQLGRDELNVLFRPGKDATVGELNTGLETAMKLFEKYRPLTQATERLEEAGRLCEDIANRVHGVWIGMLVFVSNIYLGSILHYQWPSQYISGAALLIGASSFIAIVLLAVDWSEKQTYVRKLRADLVESVKERVLSPSAKRIKLAELGSPPTAPLPSTPAEKSTKGPSKPSSSDDAGSGE